MEDVDLYDDLAEYDLGTKLQKLESEVDTLKTHCKGLEDDVSKLCDKILQMKKVQENLERNVSELYKTAKAEIERKDRTIADLRMQLEDKIFRRKRKPVEVSCVQSNTDRIGTSKESSNTVEEQNKAVRNCSNKPIHNVENTELPMKQIIDNKNKDSFNEKPDHRSSSINNFKRSLLNDKRHRGSSPEDKSDRKRSRYDYEDRRKQHGGDRNGRPRNRGRSVSRDRNYKRDNDTREQHRSDSRHSKDRNYNDYSNRRPFDREAMRTKLQRNASPEIELPSLDEFPLSKDLKVSCKTSDSTIEKATKNVKLKTSETALQLQSEQPSTDNKTCENDNKKPPIRSTIYPKPNISKETKDKLKKLGVAQPDSSLLSYKIPHIKEKRLDDTGASIKKLIEQEKARILITDPKQSPVHESSRTPDTKISNEPPSKKITLDQYRSNNEKKNEENVMEGEHSEKEEGELDDSLDLADMKKAEKHQQVKKQPRSTENIQKRRKSTRILQIEEQKKRNKEETKLKDAEKEANNKKENAQNQKKEVEQPKVKELVVPLQKLKNLGNTTDVKNSTESEVKNNSPPQSNEKVKIISQQIIIPASDAASLCAEKTVIEYKQDLRTLQDVVASLNLSDFDDKVQEPPNNNAVSASEMNMKVFSLSNTSNLLNSAETYHIFQMAAAQPEIPNLNVEDIMATTGGNLILNPALFNQNANLENPLNSTIVDVTLPSVSGTAYLNSVSVSGDSNVKGVLLSIPENNTKNTPTPKTNIPINIPQQIIKAPKLPSIFSPLKCPEPPTKAKKVKTNVVVEGNSSTFVKQIEDISDEKAKISSGEPELPVVDIADFIKTIKTDQEKPLTEDTNATEQTVTKPEQSLSDKVSEIKTPLNSSNSENNTANINNNSSQSSSPTKTYISPRLNNVRTRKRIVMRIKD